MRSPDQFMKGDFQPFLDVHPMKGDEFTKHEVEFHTEGGFIKAVCITCGIYQPLAELEAGLPAVEKA